jgi:hypothetical protein
MARPVTEISRTTARLSFTAATIFLVLLAALHLVKPELDPSWRMVSEYEIRRLVRGTARIPGIGPEETYENEEE